eukprot:2770372-Amphidinium_carterae.1
MEVPLVSKCSGGIVWNCCAHHVDPMKAFIQVSQADRPHGAQWQALPLCRTAGWSVRDTPQGVAADPSRTWNIGTLAEHGSARDQLALCEDIGVSGRRTDVLAKRGKLLRQRLLRDRAELRRSHWMLGDTCALKKTSTESSWKRASPPHAAETGSIECGLRGEAHCTCVQTISEGCALADCVFAQWNDGAVSKLLIKDSLPGPAVLVENSKASQVDADCSILDVAEQEEFLKNAIVW